MIVLLAYLLGRSGRPRKPRPLRPWSQDELVAYRLVAIVIGLCALAVLIA